MDFDRVDDLVSPSSVDVSDSTPLPSVRDWWRWPRARGVAVTFIVSTLAVVVAITVVNTPSYQATALLVVHEDPIYNEWDILRDETRSVDLEETVRSRAVLGMALEQMPPEPGRPSALGPAQVALTQWRQQLSKWWRQLADRTPWLQSLASVDNSSDAPKPAESADVQTARAIERFRADVFVERVHHSQLLSITVTDPNPQRAALEANVIGRAFIDHHRDEAITRSAHELAIVTDELDALQQALEDLSREQNTFLSQHGWNDYEVELDRAQSRVNELRRDLRELEAHRAHFHAGATLTDQLARSDVIQESPGVIDAAAIQKLAKELAQADFELNTAQSRYLDGAPLVVQARRKRDLLARMFAERVQVRHAVLNELLAESQVHLQSLMAESAQAKMLTTAIEQTENRFQQLLHQRDELRLHLSSLEQATGDFGHLTFLDDAIPPRVTALWKRVVTSMIMASILCLLVLASLPWFFRVLDTHVSDHPSLHQWHIRALDWAAADSPLWQDRQPDGASAVTFAPARARMPSVPKGVKEHVPSGRDAVHS